MTDLKDPGSATGFGHSRTHPVGRHKDGRPIAWGLLCLMILTALASSGCLAPNAPPPANVPPVAKIKTNVSSARIGEVVGFDGSGSIDPDGTIVSHSWDFGDGTRIAGVNVLHAFGAAGDFTVRLTVADNQLASGEATMGITILEGPPLNQPPTAVSRVPSLTVYVTQPVAFDGSGSSDPDGVIVRYEWDFGDGATASGPIIEHVYAAAGSFQPKLLVTDDRGATAAATLAMTVLPAGKDRAVLFTPFPPNQFVARDVSFAACASEDIALADELRWDWGDGTSDVVKHNVDPADCWIKHQWTSKGTKQVRLEISYKDAGKGSFYASVGINEKLTGSNATHFVNSVFIEPTSLDPSYDYEAMGAEVISNTYETLYFYDRARADVFVPVLAESMPTVSPDGTEYTMKIRKGVKFFSGNEMKATDAAFSFRRVVTMAHSSGPSWMLEQLTTAYAGRYVGRTIDEWTRDVDGWGQPPSQRLVQTVGKGPTETITEDDVWKLSSGAFFTIDDFTLRIVLERPYQGLISILAHSVGSVTEEAQVKSICGFPIRNQKRCTDVPANGLDVFTPAGTGPYQLKKGDWLVGTSLLLTANPNWWKRSMWGYELRLDKVTIRFDPTLATRVQLLKNGDADTSAMGYRDSAQVVGDPNLRITKDLPTFIINVMGMNQDIMNLTGQSIPRDFYSDIDVRKAFAHVFNYKGFVDNCVFGGAKQAPGPIPEGMFGYKDVGPLRPQFDKAKAENHFKSSAAGWWTKGFWIEVAYNAGNTARMCAANLLKQELEALNPLFHANVTAYDWPTYLSRLASRQLGFFIMGKAPDYADPDDFVTILMRSTGEYARWSGYKNSTVDSLVDMASVEQDLTKRKALYGRIQEAAFYDMPNIWQTQPYTFHVERTWVQGWFYNPLTLNDYAAMMKGLP